MMVRLSERTSIYMGYLLFALNFQCCGSNNRSNIGYHWGTWSKLPISCSVTCGKGVRCRVRKCLDGFGSAEPIAQRCYNPEDYESKEEWCTPCVVSSQCPTLPGWSMWTAWSKCMPSEGQRKELIERCQLGVRKRRRRCDNPPPEPQPEGVECSGPNQQTIECRYNCDKKPLFEPANIATQIQLRVEADHRKGLRNFKRVIRKQSTEAAEMSCDTPAYRLAKRLTVIAEYEARRQGLNSEPLRMIWYKNGKPLRIEQPRTRLKKVHGRKTGRTETKDELLQEQHRWEALHTKTFPEIIDDKLTFSSIRDGDRGFYTCELSWGEHRWMTIFYSLVISGTHYVAQVTDSFYLHSNLGYENALREAPVWLEAAQIVWKQNGLVRSQGLAARRSRRIQIISELNQTHNGMWTCYLIIPATGPTSRMSNPWVRVSGVYLLNEFHLRVGPNTNGIWQLADNSVSKKMLRNVSITLALLCELSLLMLLLTIWASKRWVDRTLSVSQKRLIVQEIVDNATRLMLTARKRAAVNRDRLLPLIIREQKRLNRAAQHLTERFVEDESEEEQSGSIQRSVWRKISKFGSRVRTISKIFKKVNARDSSIVDVEGWRYSRSGSIISTDSRPSDTTERVTKLRKLFGMGEDPENRK